MPGRGALSPPAPPRQSPTAILISTWPGRLFLISASLKFLVAVWRAFAELPAPIHVISTAASIGLAVALFVFVWRLFVLMKRQLLWRVRRKLILSYIFIGVVPSLLIIVFFLFCSAVLFMGVAAYLFKSGYAKVATNSWPLASSLLVGVAAALLSGAVMGLLHAVLSIRYRVNQIISGTVIIIFASGFTSYLIDRNAVAQTA